MNSSVNALAVSGGTLYAGGYFTMAGGSAANYIAQWDGSSWSAIGSGMNSSVNALAVSGGTLYASGGFTTAGGSTANRIARWDGSSWSALGSALGTGMNSTVWALAVSGGTLYAGGYFTMAGGSAANYIAQWNGSNWSALGSGMNGGVYALVVSGGTLYAGGTFKMAGGVAANYIAQWNGSSWSALGSGMNGMVFALAGSGGMLYAGGGFTTAGGVAVNCIAQWDGSNWSALGSGMNMNSEVRALVVSGGTLYAGGDFTTAGGVAANRIARWDGSSWSALGLGMNGPVWALAASGATLYAGGDFNTAGGVAADYIARWNGSNWSALSLGVNSSVRALAVSGGALYAGGWFTTAGLTPANRIAQWDGSSWSALGSGMNNTVWALAVSDGTLYSGGDFTTAGGKASGYAAKAVFPPYITTHPANQTANAGQSAMFNVIAEGTPLLNYQWCKGGVPLADGGNVSGSSTFALSLSNVHIADAGNYSVVITNIYGALTSSVASLTVVDLVILTQPSSRTNNVGTAATFSVGMMSPSSFGYQWYKGITPLTDGTNIAGSKTFTLTLNGVLGGDAGGYSVGYSVVVTNFMGSVTSSVASLTVSNDPTIVTQPVGLTNNAGTTATFSVGVLGSTPVSYQWFKGGLPVSEGGNISGSTNATLTLVNVLGADAGSYSVVVTNAFGVVTSSVAKLSVIDPVIVTQPSNQNVNPGQSATFGVVAVGSIPMTYQWRKGGVSMAGGTNLSLTLTNLQVADSGSTFDVVVSNSFGSVTSSVATLIVNTTSGDAFFPDADGPVSSITIQPDGKILLGGSFATLGGLGRNNIGRLNSDGTVETNFNPGTDLSVYSLAVQTDGKILAGGGFSYLDDQYLNYIGRLNPDGTVDLNFNPGADADGTVNSVVIQPDGKILLSGYFETLGGAWWTGIGRLNPDGTADYNFNPYANDFSNTLQLQPDGKILVGGFFTVLGGQSRSRLGRLDTDGTTDASFNPGADATVDCLALQADGKILVGGNFSTLGGQSRSRIGRLNADGTLDATFNPGADGDVLCLAVQADGKILVGGNFTTLAGQSRSYIGRLNADGSIDNTFNVGVGGVVQAIGLQEDGKILVGGNFGSLAGQSRHNIGRLNNTDPATESLSYDGINITWLRGGTLPEVWWATFEESTDGTNWTMLGSGTRIVGGWSLSGMTISNGIIRARGYSTGGDGHSSGLVEADLNLNLPNIVSQPVSCTNTVGTTANFTVGANGLSPFAYQWFKAGSPLTDGGNIFGAASSVLSLGNLKSADAGNYFVVVSNNWGSVTSRVAQLTVTLPPPPLVFVTTNGTFGFKNQQFRFTLTGPAGSNVVISASTDLQTWTPLATNPLTLGSLIFTDILATNFTQRFYRANLE
jgi:uncharacterized delta-60 repeat protein